MTAAVLVVGCTPLEFDETSENFQPLPEGPINTNENWSVGVFRRRDYGPARIVAIDLGDIVYAGDVESWAITETGWCIAHQRLTYQISWTNETDTRIT